MATVNKDFIVKNGIVISGTTATVNGSQVVDTSATAQTKTGNFTSSGEITGTLLRSTNSAGDEGGEILLSLASTNTTLVSGIAIDVYQNRLRFFETGGGNRGAYIDLSVATTGVGSNLLAGGSASDSFKTISTPSGTSPVADSSTDTLTLSAGTGISITGDATADSVTFTNTGVTSINGSTGAVINIATSGHTHTLDNLSDVVITSATTSQVLKYNGTNWVNDTDSNNAYSMGGFEPGGIWYAPVQSGNNSTVTAVDDRTDYLPFYVPVTTTFDRIALWTAAGFAPGTGTSVRLGIYNNSTNRPDTVLLDAGTVNVLTANTQYTITINQTINPGWYWLAFNMQSTGAGGTHSFSGINILPTWGYMRTNLSQNRVLIRQETGITGAFATAGTLNNNQVTIAPGVFLRTV